MTLDIVFASCHDRKKLREIIFIKVHYSNLKENSKYSQRFFYIIMIKRKYF
mgnify:CR=1 FL=1